MRFQNIFSKIEHIKNLATWIPQAETLDTLDSPFLYDFTKKVVWNDPTNLKIDEIEKRRKQFQEDSAEIELEDYGRGTFEGLNKVRTISQLANTAVSNQSKCKLLYNLVQYFEANSILELGTNLGISTLYLASAYPQSPVVTIEGDLRLIGIAAHHSFPWAEHIEYINGQFEPSLNLLLNRQRVFDVIYIDGGHHSKIQNDLLPYYNGLSNAGSVWIIDDIYWSKDMTAWWKTIKKDTRWNIAIDMYHFGILTYQSRMKEAIDVKILPHKVRWKPGVARR